MMIHHHDLTIELYDEWWKEAGMEGFTPSSPSYASAIDKDGRRICSIEIRDIAPFRRLPGVPIFNDSHFEGITAAERVTRILRGFIAGVPIPPIEVVELSGGPHRFKSVNGAHRLYCSLAAGFTHVPAVEGYDFEPLDVFMR
jgi:hypothetical protein